MRDVVIGIDLGTTNSCVAIPESADVPNVDELLDSRRLKRVGGALVLTDRLEAATTPSAVWLDEDGTPLVGGKAKKKAKIAGEPKPALFFKRVMGVNDQLAAGHGTLTPEQASGHVLAHMKGVAEEVLGREVTRAVVTVPAFFEMNARQATTRAGELAGLEVVDALLEPVAAARMHTRTTTLVEPRTFLVYDLGGGTFDVSVVTWDPEVEFEMRAFDGDRFLGGYDFDRAIVNWMLEQLGDRYDLDLDIDDNPGDAALFARLLVHAEEAKQNLSRSGPDGLETEIVDTMSEDRAGNPMHIRLDLARPELEQMIAQRVDSTLESCDRALEKAGVKAEDVDDIIMVGGSSRMPLVPRRLEEKYGRKPLVIDPDLCVAVGAALKAAAVATASSYLSVNRVPETTAAESIDISGAVLEGDAVPSAAAVTVQLTSADGLYQKSESTDDEGRFLFEDVRLQPDADNRFTVGVLAGDGAVDTQELSVQQSFTHVGGDGGDEGDYVLPHDVRVAVVGGYHVVAPAGTRLPSHQQVLLQKADEAGFVSVELYESASPIGAVVVEDVPASVPIGAQVDVELVFNRDWTIDVSAGVPAANADASATIEIPTVPLPSWEELRSAFTKATLAWSDLQQVASPAERMQKGPRIDALLAEVEDLLNERQDRAHANHGLQEIDTLLKGIKIDEGPGLKPPLEEFEQDLATLEGLVGELETEKPEVAANYRNKASALESAGRAAWEAENAVDWRYANDQVKETIAKLTPLVKGDTPPPRPHPIMLQMHAAEQLEGIIDTVRGADEATGGAEAQKAAGFIEEAEALGSQVSEVDMSDEDAAFAKLAALINGKIYPLRKRVKEWLDIILGTGKPTPGKGIPQLPPETMRIPGAVTRGKTLKG